MRKYLRLALKNAEVKPESFKKLRNNEIRREIRSYKPKEEQPKPYESADDEIAILRKQVAVLADALSSLLNREVATKEFTEYNAYVEQCKANVKASMHITD